MFRSPLVVSLVKLALEEDLAFGDITSELTIPRGHRSSAVIVAREKLVAAGLPIIETIFDMMGARAKVKIEEDEGTLAKDGTVLARIEAKTADLLSAERTILNFLQRISGVATHTRTIVAQAKGLTVLDTRKTLPGWRVLDKYSVKLGGGTNHRFHLGDMVLVKNNHIDAHGGDMRATLRTITAKKPRYMPFEVEVRNLKELQTALEFKPQVVMLDNMKDSEIRKALRLVEDSGQEPMVEISGGVHPKQFARLKKLGVHCVSMGALTTQAMNVDISMRMR
ncbi:MAG: carboxylating nicotinate-nucleotide diphosphorylase [Deltaproteobacteria bacterium]|nr:carboxylating nicotinate-nucleotide diphosphorylase [Deltaproteobacteria bacterium]